MANKDLERLLELESDNGRGEILDSVTLEEYNTLKSKLESQLLSEGRCNPECKELHKFHEQQIKELQEDRDIIKNQWNLSIKEMVKFKAVIDGIEKNIMTRLGEGYDVLHIHYIQEILKKEESKA
jgi:hypothetical protein